MIPPPDPVIDAYVKRIVDQAPPLTDEQKHCIAVLLQPDPPIERKDKAA